MPRKKEIIEQPIHLSPDVQVIIRAPRSKWPHIVWNGGHVEIDISAGEPSYTPLRLASVQTNGPDRDTPELIAARAKLPDVLGGAKRGPARGTNEEVWGNLGIDLAPGELTPEALEAAAVPIV